MISDKQRLEHLLAAWHPCISIVTSEEDDALELVRETAAGRPAELWLWSINGGLRDGLVAQGPSIADTEHPAAALYHLQLQSEPATAVMLDLGAHLKDARTLRLFRDLVQHYRKNGGHVVLIDHDGENLPEAVKSIATPFELTLPETGELERLVRSTLRKRNEERRVQVELTRKDLDAVVAALRGLTRRQARQVVLDACCDEKFDAEDIGLIFAHKRRALQGSGLLEYVEAPVSLDEIGGLRQLKFWLEQRRAASSEDAQKFGLQAPRGILMLGVQGAGKSLSAKAVATAWRWPLLRMDVGALYDRYIGESERRLRDSLHQAERMAPMVLWIDEIEKAFAGAASHSTDGGLSRRMFGTLLTWMQEHGAAVFIIATANDIEALPPELLRKGRFDEIFFVDLPALEVREQIFAIHIRKRGRDPKAFELRALAEAAEGFSGAEIEQAVIAALHSAFSAGAELTTERILEAVRASPPLSVTMAERVAALRGWAQGRCVPAD